MTARRIDTVALFLLLATACAAPDATPGAGVSATERAVPSSERPRTPSGWPDRYGLGQPASLGLIAALDTDVDTTGAGLPEGHGTAAEGSLVYQAKCASCHGAKGEGIKPWPALIRPLVPTDSFPWARNAAAPKTVGNYWPFATTLYAYVRHAMPQTAPGSLSPDEVYQLVAYLLAENGVLPHDAVLNATTLPAVKLPMRKRFVLDARRGGAELR